MSIGFELGRHGGFTSSVDGEQVVAAIFGIRDYFASPFTLVENKFRIAEQPGFVANPKEIPAGFVPLVDTQATQDLSPSRQGDEYGNLLAGESRKPRPEIQSAAH